jgi:Mrp family chromosome partitioning ATPase
MDQLIAGLGYDHIVFDSPPAIAVADPLIIAHTVNVSILVVKAGKTPRNLVRMAAEKLAQATSGTFGTVLNNVDPDNHGAGLYRYESVYMADDSAADSPTARVRGAGA